LEDDIAAKTLGSNWRIPSKKDFQELIDNTVHEWDEIDGRYGYKFKSKTDSEKYIFLPAAGYHNDPGDAANINDEGCYWTSDLRYNDRRYAEAFCFNSSNINITDVDKYYGYSIRPVSSKLKTINSVGVGESDGDHRNAIEITTDGSIFVKGVGDYDGSNPQSGKSLQ